MCGICGFINRDGAPADVALVRRMNATLTHRGPDDQGDFVQGPVALGHRRLSIVDVSRGHQPMRLDSSPFTVVYNGEIYNHRQLRQELSFPPQRYRTTCDTETILAAYECLGTEAVQVFQGMFALAIHDARDNSLFLARDRLGIKPLYYYSSERLFAFASEIKALLAHPDIAPRVNEDKLPVQLALKYTLDDETLFAGIKKLMPGHLLQIRQGPVSIRQYWELSYEPKSTWNSLEEAAEEFRDRFDASVRARLMADVPLGVFLSGGIDSSVIAASMSRMVDEPIKAFSIGFAERGYSELDYSRLVADHVGAQVREVVLSPQEWFAAWPRMVYHEDEPIAHPSSISLHFVSALAAREVKVVLTGEGSDELLGGYERYYQTLANLRYGRFVPQALRRLASRAIDYLPDQCVGKRKAVRTSLVLPNDIRSLYLDNYAAFGRKSLLELLPDRFHDSVRGRMYDGFEQWMRISDARQLLDQILYADMKTYLHELLMKQDQMSMSASLESRVPFLDHRLVEFATRLPVNYKLQGFDTKRILRRALGPSVPPPIVSRSKKGFPTPTREWFRGAWADPMRKLLTGPKSLVHEYVRPAAVAAILDRHQSGAWDLQEEIWTLGNLELWLRIFFDGQRPEEALPLPGEELACASSG